MNFERTITRYGHGSGHTIVFYTSDDETFLSAGNDGDIHIWKGIEDDDPTTGCTGEFIASLAFYDHRVFVGTDVNTVQILTYPELDRDGTQYRFTAMATAIRANDKYVAAGSEDTNIKVYQTETSVVVDLVGHDGPILALDITEGGLLASSSGDGTVRVWNIADQTVVKTFEGFTKVKSFSLAECLVSPCFSPNGKYLTFVKDKELIVNETETWTERVKLKDDSLKGIFTTCGISGCGRFIAAGTTKGELVVWTVDGDIVKGNKTTDDGTIEAITSLHWNPNGAKQFVFADKAGQLGCVNITGDDNTHGRVVNGGVIANNVDNQSQNNDDGDDDDDDDDNDDCISLEKLKNETMKAAGFDLEGNILGTDEDTEFNDIRLERGVPKESGGVKLCLQQKAFQPGATPDHLEHRYLVWNEIGIVRSHKTDTENSIEAEFHDASLHHGIHMSNFLNHTMAALSSTVLALGGGDQSKLVCIALGAGSREWSITLPNCEEIVALTASQQLVAVGTDTRFVRLFSFMGNQREVISVPGPIVAMASYRNKIAIVYHHGVSVDEQQLTVLIVETLGMSLRSQQLFVPMSPRSKLAWLGFTDRGTLITLDTFGMVRAAPNGASGGGGSLWLAICDTTVHAKGASDNFFIIDASEGKQIMQAILCRGTKFPLTHPRPMVMELPLRMPLCEIETEKSQWEDDLLRNSIFNVDHGQKAVQEAALKLFALACRSEIEIRARDLIEMIGSSSLIPLAAKYANKLGRIHLAEKLSELLPRMLQVEEEKKQEVAAAAAVAAAACDMEANNSSSSCMDVIPSSLESPAVVVAPKLMKMTSGKRNPFKRSSLSSPLANNGRTSAAGVASPHNPIKHLTDAIIGLPNNNNNSDVVQDEVGEEQAKETAGVMAETTNSPVVKSSPQRQPFIAWFTEHREALSGEVPATTTAAELTSYAMKKYKQTIVGGVGGLGGGNASKRKLEDKENGAAKLAKFRAND